MKLRSILQEQCFDKQFVGAPCIYQVPTHDCKF
jgi:hypothetical protein